MEFPFLRLIVVALIQLGELVLVQLDRRELVALGEEKRDPGITTAQCPIGCVSGGVPGIFNTFLCVLRLHAEGAQSPSA